MLINWRGKLWIKIVAMNLVGIFLFSEVSWTRRLNFFDFLPAITAPQLLYEQNYQKDLARKIQDFFMPSAYAEDSVFDDVYKAETQDLMPVLQEKTWDDPQKAWEQDAQAEPKYEEEEIGDEKKVEIEEFDHHQRDIQARPRAQRPGEQAFSHG
jgi:hypothetical protein